MQMYDTLLEMLSFRFHSQWGISFKHANEPSSSIHIGNILWTWQWELRFCSQWEHLVNMVMRFKVLFTVGTSCEHSNDPSGSIHGGKQLQLKKDSVPWSWIIC